MIGIEEIKQRLLENPEPKEVTEIREKIRNSFNKLEFEPVEHRYFLENKKYELVSVSKFIKQFEQPADWDEICERTARKRGVDPIKLRKEWDYNNRLATTSGTVAHMYAENFVNLIQSGDKNVICEEMKQQYEIGYLFPASPKQTAARDAIERMIANPNIYVVMSETKVYNTTYAGTFDLLLYNNDPNPEKRGLMIVDWKTNRCLKKDFVRDNDIMMLPPFDNLYDDALGHYTIQQSAYQIPLEDLGLKVVSRTLVHLKEENGTPAFEFVSLPDITKQIRAFIAEKKEAAQA